MRLTTRQRFTYIAPPPRPHSRLVRLLLSLI